jgi:hypothetical protein
MLDFFKKQRPRPNNNGNGENEMELEEVKAPKIDDVLANIDQALNAREEEEEVQQRRTGGCGCGW